MKPLPLTVIAVGEKMIGEGEGPHGRANPLPPVVHLTRRRWPVERAGAQRIHDDRIQERHREVNRVAADGREVLGRHRQRSVPGDEECVVDETGYLRHLK